MTGRSGATGDAALPGQKATLLVAGALVVVAAVVLAPMVASIPVASALLAAVLYFFSHLLRAFRLAFLSVDLLGISGRTTVLMHFATAPISLALPFKLGELVRLHELWRLSGTLLYSIVALLVDRMYDALFLVPFLVILLMQGNAAPSVIVLTSVAAFIPLIAIVVGPRLLTEVQRYVVANHDGAGTLGALHVIDQMRRVTTHAAGVARQQAPTLAVLSAMIWMLEVLVCLIVITAITGAFDGTFDLLGQRLAATWWTSGTDSLIPAIFALTLLTTLATWPFVIGLYIARRFGTFTESSQNTHRGRFSR